MTTARAFNSKTTMQLLGASAQRGRLIAYKQVSRHYGIADQDWAFVGALVVRHLDTLLAESARKGAPLLPLLAVPHKSLPRGDYAPRRLRKLGALLGREETGAALQCFIYGARLDCFLWARKRAPFLPIARAPQPPRQYKAVR